MEYVIIDAFNFTLAAASVAMYRADSEDFSSTMINILKSMLYKLQSRFSGADLYAVWDTYGGTKFRKEKYPDYKSTRDKSQMDFEAVKSASSIYDEYGVTNVYVPECEADDAIFVLCKALKKPDNTVTIVTRDHDMIQVVQSGYSDRIWDNTKKSFMDIPAYSVVDMKSLVGDGSDNIKGVPGIGKVTAMKILTGFKELTEEQKKEFERCKDIIDATRHPRFEENLEYIKKNYIK